MDIGTLTKGEANGGIDAQHPYRGALGNTKTTLILPSSSGIYLLEDHACNRNLNSSSESDRILTIQDLSSNLET